MSAVPASYILQELHLYNWGAFAGRHQVSIDPGNSALIGPTGSGKTTLVDALMTLLCASPRYNLASTGGHESDRDLVSYVRGASGQGNDSGDHIARPGRCATGIAARLVRGGVDRRGGSESVWLGALLWFDGSSQSAGDMQKRWLFAQGEGHTLDLWLEEQHSGGARALTRLAKDSDGLQMFTSKAPYLARLHSFFEVGSNAFTLLNRAAGLKQLNSIDDIFRELVLDDHSAFDDAQKVVDGFAELASIHADLERANAQLVSLLPLRDLAARERQQAGQLAHLQVLQQRLPRWFATQGAQWWSQRVASLESRIAQRSEALQIAQGSVQTAQGYEQDLHGIYLQAGGASIESLQSNVSHAHQALERTRDHLSQYRALVRNLGLGAVADAASLPDHQAQAHAALERLDADQAALQAHAERAIAKAHNARESLEQAEADHHAVRQRPGSNLPMDFQRFRTDLAGHLDLPDEALPFVAELVEVQKVQHAWRGAIERALGSHRLRILVPPDALRTALQWVNQRHNRLHVRLMEAHDAAPATFLGDGFACKLNLKPHAHQHALRWLLADLDRHCVADAEALERTPHAMTAQGLMSSRSGHFDKQDQKRLDQDWMTGFDNRDRLAQLLRKKELAAQEHQALEAEKTQILNQQRVAREQRGLWASLQTLRAQDLDTTAAEAQLQHRQQQLQALLNPQSDTAQARQRWETAQTRTRDAETALRDLHSAQTQDATLLDDARKKHGAFQSRTADGPGAGEDFAEQLVRIGHRLPELDGDNLDAQEREAGTALHAKTHEAGRKLAGLHNDIVRQMGKAKAEDRGALADHAQDVEALPHYLHRLQVLEEEALPEKRQRFQEYLNNTSQQGVDTLLNGIAIQVTDIEERIAQLNATLRRVDFQSGRYLQLEPRAVVHQSLQELSRAQAQLRTERLRDDGGHSHYRALRAIVEMLQAHAGNRRGKAAQALLDARYRLQFAVLVIDRASGQMLERRTGSQGGSGGEKEIIASYVLTASLSYALCPDGAGRPVFGTIVLDEAFSKSSQAVAARIIQALREFGLHALFVTPNKEVRLLRNHTRSAVVVHRRGAQATLASLRWEEIDAFRQRIARA